MFGVHKLNIFVPIASRLRSEAGKQSFPCLIFLSSHCLHILGTYVMGEGQGVPQFACARQRPSYGSWFFPFPIWLPGSNQPRLAGLVASALTS